MKKELMLNITIFIVVLGIIGVTIFMTLKEMNIQVEDYEQRCSRMSMNEFEDNCFCPCDEPNWIERKLGLGTLCDGWIVKKNESCLNGVTFVEN